MLLSYGYVRVPSEFEDIVKIFFSIRRYFWKYVRQNFV